MILLQYLQNPAELIVFLLAIVLAVSVHEAAHAWAADKLGDSTAKNLGRTSLNPAAHLDPIGSLLFLLVGFGWGKPVPVDERNLRRPHDMVLVALAGPASNLVVAILLGLALRFAPISIELATVFNIFTLINLSLMIFNLLPIPPLDGSKLLRYVIGDERFAVLEQNSMVLILAIFLLLNFGLGSILGRIITALFTLITGAA